MKTNKKGISLIVLVITIIVMIVLAGAIVVTLANNGIIERAKEARDKANLNEVKEAANLLWSEAYINNIRDQEGLEDAVINGLTAQKVDTTKYTITVTTSGVTVELKEDSEDEDDDETTVTQLAAPTIAISEDTLTITDNAANGDKTEQFEIYVGTEKKTTIAKETTTTLDLTTLNLAAGTYSITVKSIGTGVTASDASSAVEYIVQAAEQEDALAGTWVFNDTLSWEGYPGISALGDIGSKIMMNFTVDTGLETVNYTSIGLSYSFAGVDLIYDSYLAYTDVGWKSGQTITITSKLSEVNEGNDLLTWLQSNATKQ